MRNEATYGKLYLIPSVIADGTHDIVITPQIKSTLTELSFFLVEDVRSARRYLSALKVYASIAALDFQVLNKDTTAGDLAELMRPLFNGKNMGVISESGCPGVADPGALAVGFAHLHGVQVVPLVGPSSILLSLMASGLNGQNFAFHGYLPIDAKESAKAIKDFERESKAKNQTQLFIETPYRNNGVFETLLKNLSPEVKLCVAIDITGKGEWIKTRMVRDWIKEKPYFEKVPAVFLFLA